MCENLRWHKIHIFCGENSISVLLPIETKNIDIGFPENVYELINNIPFNTFFVIKI